MTHFLQSCFVRCFLLTALSFVRMNRISRLRQPSFAGVSYAFYSIKKRPVKLATGRNYRLVLTTYYCIPTYEFFLTVENRASLLQNGSAASSGVIFHLHPAPGSHHPRLALAFTQIYCLHQCFLKIYFERYHYNEKPPQSQGFHL